MNKPLPSDHLAPKKVNFDEIRRIAKDGEHIVEKEAKEQWKQEVQKIASESVSNN